MRIRMDDEHMAAGPDGVLQAGSEVTVSRERAAALVAAGAAEYVSAEDTTAPEVASAETADGPLRDEPPRRRRQAHVAPLEAVRGVGDERVEELNAIGIMTVPQLAAAETETLTQVHGVGPATAEKLRTAARELLR